MGSPVKRTPTTTNTKQRFAVSVSHYTVVEFLESPYILTNPSTAFFSLSPFQIRYEFAKSVFRQALSAAPVSSIPTSDADDPTSPLTDYERDREAYCLTLGCAVALLDEEDLGCGGNINAGEVEELVDLCLQYFNPSMSHFGRFRGIQRRIALDPMVSGIYYLGSLPTLFVDDNNRDRQVTMGGGSSFVEQRGKVDMAAKTLACILSLPADEFERVLIKRCVDRLVQWAGVTDLEEIMGVRIKGFRTVRNWYHPDVLAGRDGGDLSAAMGFDGDDGDGKHEGYSRMYREDWFEATVGELRALKDEIYWNA